MADIDAGAAATLQPDSMTRRCKCIAINGEIPAIFGVPHIKRNAADATSAS